VTPEEIIRGELARQGVRLQPGFRWPVRLENAVMDPFGHLGAGPHIVGRVDADGWDRFVVRLTDRTPSGRDARALLRDGLLDVIFDDDAVRLVP
jgi:hypothetical protein